MASPAYEQILALQALDLSLTQLRHRHSSHPARGPVIELEQRLAELDGTAELVAQRRHELERQRKGLEDEAATVQARRQDVDRKLYDGSVTASKDLLALQDEAVMLRDRQTNLEDRELDIMEQLEVVDGELEALADQRAGLMVDLEASRDELSAALSELEAEIASVETERSSRAVAADSELLRTYETLKDQFGGVAVARLVNGTCDGCHIKLSAVAVDQMTKLAGDEVVTCEECGRLLVH